MTKPFTVAEVDSIIAGSHAVRPRLVGPEPTETPLVAGDEPTTLADYLREIGQFATRYVAFPLRA